MPPILSSWPTRTRSARAPSTTESSCFGGLSSQLPSPTANLPYDRKCPVCVGQATVVLGQPDFTTTTENLTATQNNLRLPTAVASDGVHVVVADTNHNRVLIWNRIPTTNNPPADVVVGQPDFVSSSLPPNNTPTAKSMRGPQGVWIQNGKLYVADTQNNRVLIYNQIPTSNGAAADVVLGEPNFTTAVEPDLAAQTTSATASNLLNPVSVTSDGVHLFVTDLGYNRVLIWNTIPTANAARRGRGDRPAGHGQLGGQQRVQRDGGHLHHRHHRQRDAGVVHRLQRHGRQQQPDVSSSTATTP